jgi:hypothetical protein
VTHMAPGMPGLFDGAGLAGRSQGAIAYSRRNPGLRQQDDRGEDNDEARTSRTFSGQLPVPTSRD